MRRPSALLTFCFSLQHIRHAAAQFPPTPEGVKVLKSKFHEKVTISFKEPGICETTPGVKSYSGYIHLPPGFLNDGDTGDDVQDYPINTFFYFLSSRSPSPTAPLTIWLNGGPGASSLMGALEENGPCLIHANLSTTPNPWSWNLHSNVLYLDQPVQVGFSYDSLTNCTVTPITSSDKVGGNSTADPGEDKGWQITPTDFKGEVPEISATHRVGTFGSQKVFNTANSTRAAAHAAWHFAQTFLAEFPGYQPADGKVSLWAESYGGHYGPAFFKFFEEQNEKIRNGTDREGGVEIQIDTLGIVNGLLDVVVQAESWIEFPYNNTYGIELFNRTSRDEMLEGWWREGGCRDRYMACRDALKERDGEVYFPFIDKDDGEEEKKHNVTEACGDLEDDCDVPINAYFAAGRGFYDIAHPLADPFPEPHMYGYLNDASVQAALGVPVNFTAESRAVYDAFQGTFDIAVGGFLEAVGYLLDKGVKVHLMYGDRDYGCNWLGGEKASLAVPYKEAERFKDAGYAPLLVDGEVKGMTRQVGGYSFTRVFQAGHEVPSYQPEAAYEIFRRATMGLDVPTGLTIVDDGFATKGPQGTWHIKNVPPEMPEPRCYILKPGSCPSDVWERFVAGKAVVKDYFVVDEDEEVQVNSGSLDGGIGQEPLGQEL